MTPIQLFETLVEWNNKGRESIVFKLDRSSDGVGETVHLAGTNSPIGQVLGTAENEITARFEVLDMLAWCIARYPIEIDIETDELVT